MAGAKVVKRNPAEKKERSQDRRRRLEADRKAKEAAVKFILPAILMVLALFVIIFFWKYGFGGVRAKTGLLGIFWKFARIGERLSPYVAICCIIMGVKILIS